MKKNAIEKFALSMLLIAILPGCNIFNWIKKKVSTPILQAKQTLTAQVPNIYKGNPITVDNIYILSSEYSPIPSQARIKLDEWFAQDDNKRLLKQLLQFKFDDEHAFENKSRQDNQHIQQENIKNKSSYNYVFKVPNLNYYIKIAGPENRARSALMERGIWPGQQPTSSIRNEVLSGRIKTYQTTSRMAYFLILQELKRTQGLEHIATQDTHLIYYPGSSGMPNDDNVFIVQKALPNNAQKLTGEKLKILSNDMLEDLIYAIMGAGLWSIKDNIFIDNKGKILYLVDLEQPNNSAPKNFFYKDAVRYYGNINAGLEHVFDMLQGETKKLQFVRKLIESHPVFQSPDYHARYKRELINMLNQKIPNQ